MKKITNKSNIALAVDLLQGRSGVLEAKGSLELSQSDLEFLLENNLTISSNIEAGILFVEDAPVQEKVDRLQQQIASLQQQMASLQSAVAEENPQPVSKKAEKNKADEQKETEQPVEEK